MHPLDYARQFNLPHPSWQYVPYKTHFGRFVCAYCNERAETADAFPNYHYLCAGKTARLQLKPYFLVDACASCRHRAERSNETTFTKRRYAILVTLRHEWQSHRGPRTSKARLDLQRRINVLSTNAR